MKTTTRRRPVRRHLPLLSLLLPLCSSGHEFWIEPTSFRVEESEGIVANLAVGQFFKGNVQSFIPQRFVEFSISDSNGERPVEGRVGDLPAIDVPSPRPGLNVIAYQSTPQSVVYEEFAKFERFARREGNPWLLDAHRQRGLPRRDVREAYTRFAKSLVQVGNAAGADRALGMALELVMETNPYAAPAGHELVVRLLWLGEALPSAQVSIYRKAGGCDASRSVAFTDDHGRARVPSAGGGRFLLNAVHVIEPTDRTLDDVDAVWESLWASTTFELPEADLPEATGGGCPPARDDGAK